MQYSAGSFNTEINSSKSFTNKHKTVIEDLEIMLEKGIPDLTMSEIASRLKISLRTLYEIAPSKDLLFIMMIDNILKKLGKKALERVSSISSPIEKLETYLKIVNQAVGPKFETYIQGLKNVKGSSKLIDYHGIESVIKHLISEGNLFIKFIKTIEKFESGKMTCMTHIVLITVIQLKELSAT